MKSEEEHVGVTQVGSGGGRQILLRFVEGAPARLDNAIGARH